jgi:hypothetical protein
MGYYLWYLHSHQNLHHLLGYQIHQIDHLLRVHQADLVIQVVIVQEVRDQVEEEVHGLEKMNNATIAALN